MFQICNHVRVLATGRHGSVRQVDEFGRVRITYNECRRKRSKGFRWYRRAELLDVTALANLARIEMTGAELVKAGADVAGMARYFQSLQDVDTDGVEPMAHPGDLRNVFREDEPHESLPVDEALKNAPQRAGDYFAVPAVFEGGE